MKISLIKKFEVLKDPRIDRHKLYPLKEILLVALGTILTGGESYEDMRVFGLSKLQFLKSFMPFENGMPSADTFERVLGLLNPKVFLITNETQLALGAFQALAMFVKLQTPIF